MTGAHAQLIEQVLAELLRKAAQAHFLRALTTDEELEALRERCLQLRARLNPDQEQAPGNKQLPEPQQFLLAAELAWIERSIVALQNSSQHPHRRLGSSAALP